MHQRTLSTERKRKRTEWEKIYANHVFDKRLESGTYKRQESTSYLIRKPSGNKCNILRIILCFHLVKFFFDFVLAGLFNSKEFLFKSFNDLKKKDNANCGLQ